MWRKNKVVYGKTIELFLVNGTADSLITAELSNWNGKAIKIPRTEVAFCEREDVTGAGVYFVKKMMIWILFILEKRRT